MSNQPAAKYRLGNVTATVWKNGDDRTFHSVDLNRSYKDGDEWKTSTSLNSGDLLNAARVLQRAEEFISAQ